MFYVMNNDKLALFDDDLTRLQSTRKIMPQLTEKTRETDIITEGELRLYPNKVIAVSNEEEVEVVDYDVETGEEIGTHTEIRVYYTLALNPNFEAEQTQKEAERIAMLYLTAADVERGIYKAKGMDFEDIIAFITQLSQTVVDEETGEVIQQGIIVDIKALKIELKANHFYRGNPYVNLIGNFLGFTNKQLDNFFEDGNYEHLLEVEADGE